MDTDKNGLIEYKEFKFMLERQGLKTRTLEETMVYSMIKAMQKLKKRKQLGESNLFELIDKEKQCGLVRAAW